jgi:hypothetical protein
MEPWEIETQVEWVVANCLRVHRVVDYGEYGVGSLLWT